ncbi:dGTP triphosphohydrolase [Teichococcus vastitatis]|uniref:DNTP triphosphohydrolase n=1 Tax=Teichococcus vastitatis TaxID=2307076 RepID=A0ABS9W5B0_9PROT|nr:dNTP triphosphohydrolase [Pseudoroseomonas vastitatis]MCI0754475.1 dNTP triphosphohydrolase [Pseudoroseomonas vastitatis]
MDWAALFNTGRFPASPPRQTPTRNPFQIDQDRIVFSRPFRRLQQKTQVHPMVTNAHVRNRLVHTLEVASVGRSIGFAVGSELRGELTQAGHTPDDLGYLVQATCLAHDIGNPPFGHAGEEVIADYMAEWLDTVGRRSGLLLDQDLRFFDGNAQGFRILTRADGYRERSGLKLTMASLGACIKYPWGAADLRSAKRGRAGVKFNCFDTEAEAYITVAAACGLSGPLPRHPAVWLMEAADDITYGLADLEDAVELRITPYETAEALLLPLAAVDRARLAEEDNVPQKLALLRSQAAGRLIGAVKDAFCAHHAAILAGAMPLRTGLIDLIDPTLRAPFTMLQNSNSDTLYTHPSKAEFEIGARDVLDKTLTVFLEACLSFHTLPEDRQPLRPRQALALMQDYHPKRGFSSSETLRCAIDFVAGMTDHYASTLAARLRGL